MQIETLQAMNDSLSRSLLLMLEVTVLIVVIGVSIGFVIYLAGIAWLCFEEMRQPMPRRMKPACPAKTPAANPVIREAYKQRAQILPLLLFLIFSFTGCGKSADAARQQLAQMNIPFTEMEFLASARQGNSTAAGLFIDAGINLEARDAVGQTALMTATLANQPETVRVLLAKGAAPDAKDKYGGTALMTAAWKGNKEITLSLLASGADLNTKANNGMTALMFAAWGNHTELTKVLLEKGADPDLKDKNGWTASMRADFKGHSEVANILKEPQRH